MAPSHGFAAASHREAALRDARLPMARPRSEAQRGSVRPAAAMRSAHCEIRPGENVTLQYLSHDRSPGPPAVRAAATVRPAATAPSPTAKSLPLDRPTV